MRFLPFSQRSSISWLFAAFPCGAQPIRTPLDGGLFPGRMMALSVATAGSCETHSPPQGEHCDESGTDRHDRVDFHHRPGGVAARARRRRDSAAPGAADPRGCAGQTDRCTQGAASRLDLQYAGPSDAQGSAQRVLHPVRHQRARCVGKKERRVCARGQRRLGDVFAGKSQAVRRDCSEQYVRALDYAYRRRPAEGSIPPSGNQPGGGRAGLADQSVGLRPRRRRVGGDPLCHRRQSPLARIPAVAGGDVHGPSVERRGRAADRGAGSSAGPSVRRPAVPAGGRDLPVRRAL